ncbi:MAG: zinc-dependent metalloprotease family protein, partial [Phycisphaerales bacterium JB065]
LAVSAIEATNQAYINSNIQTRVRLVQVTEVEYTESGSFNTDLSNLRGGVVPGVLEMRDEVKADLVAMLSTSSGACGIGYLMQSLDPAFESSGFSVTNYGCAVGNLSFAHELGHNMGCQHDADNAGSNPIFPYSFGWRWTANGGPLRRSVMSYAPGSRVPHFSNPNVLNGGQPTGVESSAYNAMTINNTAYLISNFRVSDCSQGPDDCAWSAVGDGLDGLVLSLTEHTDASGRALYAGGNFEQAGDQPVAHIARWDGQQWSAVGTGINGTVHALESVTSGPLAGLYASGFFSSAGGVAATNIARWDGSSWSPLAGGLNNRAYAMAVFDDGSGESLYAAGIFTNSDGIPLSRIARWDGESWNPVGGGLNGTVNALEVFDDGTGPALYAAGLITLAGGEAVEQVARWDGQQWSAVGANGPDDMVNDLVVFDDGTGPALYAAGRFMNADDASAEGIARWDGLNWTAVGDGLGTEVFALLAFRDTDGPALFASGNFVTTIDLAPALGIAKWNGNEWSRMGLGLSGDGGRSLVSARLGLGPAMFVGGGFSSAGSQQASSIARWSCASVLCPQDVDGDGEVSLADLNLVLAGFGQQTDDGDTNADGVVDLADLNAVLAAFGQACP